MENSPVFTNDAIVFGLLMLALGFVFYTESRKTKFWTVFYKYVPGLLMCYLIPAIFNSLGWISADVTQTYFISSQYLLPASLVLLTISIDFKIYTCSVHIIQTMGIIIH